MSTSPRTPRIVIYGVGQYGGFIARFAEQKGWPIVAAFNRAGPKVGQDLGRVVGLDRDLGVIVQDCDSADYSALKGKADIGIIAQTNILRVNMPAYQRLMDAGLNVLCHGAQSYYPHGNDPVTAAEIDSMAQRNGVTFTGGGIWDMSRIWSGILVLGPCTDINALHHHTLTDVLGQSANAQQARQVGTGMTAQEYEESGLRNSPIAGMYRTIPEHVLTATGFTIKSKREYLEPIYFDAPIHTDMLGTIPVGICAGSRIVAEIQTEEGPTASASIELRLFKPGEVEHMFWEVDGKPRSRVRVERDDSAHATASNLFNRIPDVIAAPPGIVLVSQMGPLKSTALQKR
jgi:4-hydroxy-tetrahydrodipicolinate reductase